MTSRSALPALVPVALLAALALTPTAGHAQFQQTWTSASTDYRLLGPIADFNHDGTVDLLVREQASAAQGTLSVRSARTGAIEAQTSVTTYVPQELDVRDLDLDGKDEFVFRNGTSLVCLPFAPPATTMTARWTLSPFGGSFLDFFADLDGNGRLFVAFVQQGGQGAVDIYDRNGALFGHYVPNAPAGWELESVTVEDFDADHRDEILLAYHDPSGTVARDHLILLESVSPVGVAMRPGDLRPLELRGAAPNPAPANTRIDYVLPTAGRVSLRLFDTSGRLVRVLADGDAVAGSHSAVWDGRDDHGRLAPAGAYFYELSSGGAMRRQRVVRLH